VIPLNVIVEARLDGLEWADPVMDAVASGAGG
jgi:hypothetical protein